MKENNTDGLLLESALPYEMDFSDDNQGQENEEKNHHGQKRPQNPRGGKSYISVILLAVALVAVIALMLYFFVFRSSTKSVTLNSGDIHYQVDFDPTTEGYDDPQNPLPEGKTFTIYDETNNPNGVIVAEGNLVPYLVNPSDYNLQLTAVQSNVSDQVIYLQGSFSVKDSNNRIQSYNFGFSITAEEYQRYILPIIDNVTYVNKDGQVLRYYASNNFQFGLESTSDVGSWLIPLLLFVAFIGIMIYLYSRMNRAMGGGSGGPMGGFVNNIARKETSSKTRFSDVAGCDEAKAELVELVDYFHSTDKYTRLGAKLPHGVLLVGNIVADAGGVGGDVVTAEAGLQKGLLVQRDDEGHFVLGSGGRGVVVLSSGSAALLQADVGLAVVLFHFGLDGRSRLFTGQVGVIACVGVALCQGESPAASGEARCQQAEHHDHREQQTDEPA